MKIESISKIKVEIENTHLSSNSYYMQYYKIPIALALQPIDHNNMAAD